MKKYLDKINNYLIENYPTIWNTRIVWVLLASLVIHIVFFILGYATLSNPEMLHERNAKEIYFKNGVVFFNVIIAVLLLVIWLVYMFKNNAFKNYYPTTKLKLFSQFISYVFIVFIATTFYYSYNIGLKTYITTTYPDDVVNAEINKTNNAAVFFLKDIDYYTVDNLHYPSPFYDLYCEKRKTLIDKSKTYLNWFSDYQFYSLKSKIIKDSSTNQKIAYNSNYVFSVDQDSITTYYYKDTVVDVSNYLKTATPSLFNYSNTFYTSNNENNSNTYLYKHLEYRGRSIDRLKKRLRNKQVYELLNRNDKNEINEMLIGMDKIFSKYHIDRNLTADKWLTLVYNSDEFFVNYLIRTEKKDPSDYNYNNKKLTLKEQFIKEHTTDFYINSDDLKKVFLNIESIKNENYFKESIHFFMWMSFILAVIIFAYRITKLRTFLFTIITIGLLVLFISLITALYGFTFSVRGNQIEFFISYLSLIIGGIILAIPLLFYKKIKKTIVAVFINISILIFPLYLFLLVIIISMHQKEHCKALYGYSYDGNCFVLMEQVGVLLSYILFVLAILFTYFYGSTIKRWKALPEG